MTKWIARKCIEAFSFLFAKHPQPLPPCVRCCNTSNSPERNLDHSQLRSQSLSRCYTPSPKKPWHPSLTCLPTPTTLPPSLNSHTQCPNFVSMSVKNCLVQSRNLIMLRRGRVRAFLFCGLPALFQALTEKVKEKKQLRLLSWRYLTRRRLSEDVSFKLSEKVVICRHT